MRMNKERLTLIALLTIALVAWTSASFMAGMDTEDRRTPSSDLNNDGKVDASDLDIMLRNWTQEKPEIKIDDAVKRTEV